MEPCTCPKNRVHTGHAPYCAAWKQHLFIVRDRNTLLEALRLLVDEAKRGQVSRITIDTATRAMVGKALIPVKEAAQ